MLRFYEGALTASITFVDDLVLTETLTQQDLERFLQGSGTNPVFTLNLNLNKAQFAESHWAAKPDCNPIPFLFDGAIEAFLSSDLAEVERTFFADPQQRKIILTLPDHDVFFDGPHLSIIGGSELAAWNAIRPASVEEMSKAAAVYETCREQANWQQVWVQHITPLHLALEYPERAGQSPIVAGSADRIIDLIRAHFANLVLLFTAQRSESREQARVGAFASASRIVEIPLRDPRLGLSDAERAGISELLKLIDWTFDDHRTGSRFALVQDTIVRELLAVGGSQRYSALLQRAATVMAQLNWRWQAFIGEKVDDYLGQVREFENDVDKTAQGFADQLAVLTKSLTDTMLGAVAAIIAALVASVIKDKFNPVLFSIGVAAYGAYVTIFHLWYGLTYQLERFKSLESNYKSREGRFAERIPAEQIDHIVS